MIQNQVAGVCVCQLKAESPRSREIPDSLPAFPGPQSRDKATIPIFFSQNGNILFAFKAGPAKAALVFSLPCFPLASIAKSLEY